MERVFERFTVSVLKINKLIQKIKAFEIREYGLKAVHVLCVYFLNCSSDGLTASELVRHTLEDKAAISRALGLLKEKGFAEYGANVRNSVVRLTAEGRRLAEFIDRDAAAAEAECCLDFTEEERAAFYISLNKIADNMRNYYEKLLKKDIEND